MRPIRALTTGRPAPPALRPSLLTALEAVPFAIAVHVLHDVTPRRMHLHATITDALASGCVCARGVLSNMLVFDGTVPQPDARPKAHFLESDSGPSTDSTHRSSRP